MENYENHLEDMIKGFQILRYPLLNDTPITNKIPENSVDIAAKYLKILKYPNHFSEQIWLCNPIP